MRNGILRQNLKALCLAGGLALLGGCEHTGFACYRYLVDPCYPERYAYMSRQEVRDTMSAQINNGHVLDQTVWNNHFEPGSEKLTTSGMNHLTYLSQRRPCPDAVVYLQTAQDISYDPAAPDRFVEIRNTLDSKRAESIKKFLGALTANRRVDFQVVVHDPAEVGMAAVA